MMSFTEEQRASIKQGSVLDAVRLSLTKWEDIAAGTGKDFGAANCALCVKCFDHGAATDEHPCRNCPLGQEEYNNGCDEDFSPYNLYWAWGQNPAPLLAALRAIIASYQPEKEEVEDE